MKTQTGGTKLTQSLWVDTILLFLLACLLIKPLFRLEYLDNWPSIYGTLISDARMLRDHWPHTQWLPLWYGGTRFEYIYPPGLLYGTALISKFGGVSPARAYHLYTALFYAFGIVAVYWLVRVGSSSRGSAVLAAVATALVSPSFLLLPLYRLDSPVWVPQRLHALMQYGEGPHMSALAILPAALAACWLSLRRWRAAIFALAAMLCAATVANNFYGATALAMFFPLVVWSVWLADWDRVIFLRAAGLTALTYGLCAAWLTPSYLKTTMMNLKWLPSPGNASSKWLAAFVLFLFAAISYRIAARRPDRMWAVFVCGCAVVMGSCVLVFVYFGLPMVGDPGRLVPELDLVLILAFVELLRRMWNRWRLRRIIAVVLALAFFYPAVSYLRHVYSPFSRAAALETQYTYRIARWAHDNLFGQRVLVTGMVRFWYDTWFDNAESDGGSLQGMLNQIWPIAIYQIREGDRPDMALLWLNAFGVDAIVVPGKASRERYLDFDKPKKFQAFPILYDDQHGTIIYRVPRYSQGIGHVVDSARLASAGPIRDGDDFETLSRYVAVLEEPLRKPAVVSWHGFDALDIQADVSPGEAILLQETYDPAWHAYQGGRELPIRRDSTMSFMVIDAPEGAYDIQMRFETPLENRVGQLVTASSLLLITLFVGWGLFQNGANRKSVNRV